MQSSSSQPQSPQAFLPLTQRRTPPQRSAMPTMPLNSEPELTAQARLIRAYNDLAITFIRQEQYDQAIAHFQKILDQAPDLPTTETAKVYFNIATVLERQDKTEDSTTYLQKALDLNPDFREAKLELAKKDYKYQISLKGYQFTQDWFSRNLLIWQDALQEQVGKPGLQFLEIGCWEGLATCWLLGNILTHASAHITCIDTFAGSEEHQADFDDAYLQSVEARFDLNISKTGAASKVKKIVGSSHTTLRSLPLHTYDFIYIDGSHLASDVLMDAVLSWDLLNVEGILAFDDYDFAQRRPEQQTRQGIDAFLTCFSSKFIILHQSHQVILRKTQK